jgi:methylenetetrahydrofolate reductase (NADPH)
VFSFEIFPPGKTAPANRIQDILDGLQGLKPDFISVTCGTGGYENSSETLKIASLIKNKYGIESVAHLPCVSLTKKEVLDILSQVRHAGIGNILALRGDINPEIAPKKEFNHASDLISFIKENSEFNIIGACYPEGHRECPNIVKDIHHLKEKVDSGANHLITQLFFDNSYFYSFRERAAIAQINVPIEAGIMPVINKKQIERIVSIAKVRLPAKFLSIMERYENNPEAMRDAGIAYAIDQIVDLLTQGVDGIHLYTMNNPDIARRIYTAVNTVITHNTNACA